MKWGLLLPLAAIGVAGDAPRQAVADPCRFIRDGVFTSLDYRDCVDLLPPQRFRGTWFVGLEESTFLPAGRPLPAERLLSATQSPPEWEIWLDAGWPEMLELLEGVPEPAGDGDTGRYEVEFIGRKARHAGQYGAGSPQLIVLDRLISIRPAGRVRTRVELGKHRCTLPDC